MRGRNTCAGGGTLDPLLQWFANAIQGKFGQLSAAVIKDGPIWRFPSCKCDAATDLFARVYLNVAHEIFSMRK